jgi:long-chain fatty acid transport protein
LLIPKISNASFIEATLGTAVVNDATATYNNPAALTLLKNPQLIDLNTIAQLNSQFSGNVTQTRNGLNEFGVSKLKTNYFLPSGYFGAPVSDKFFYGLAILANNFNRDADQGSILRYVISDNNIQDLDWVPAVGYKWNDYFSIGGGLNLSQANFVFKPISGFPNMGVPDVQSNDKASARAFGGDLGILIKPSSSTQIGFNYRSSMTYHFHGTSQLGSNPAVNSNNFSFDYWTPTRYVLSVNQFLSKSLGLIGTVQWIKWDIYNNINAHGIVTLVGPTPVVLQDVTIPLHFHNSWVGTLGGYYNLSSQWAFRMAGSFVQSPGNPNFQVTQGDNIVLGASLGYKLSKMFSIDAAYAHAFILDQTINIQNSINRINGVTNGYRDSVSLKLTANI